jgi:ATP-dependent RNA helicase RhlE
MSFNSLGLSDALKIIKKRIHNLSNTKAIPPILEGKDVLASAQTGTGKQPVFTLPILQILSQGKHLSQRPIRALILTPTRELAAQILANIKEYSEF